MSLNVKLAKRWSAVPGVKFPAPVERLINDSRAIQVRPPQADWISAPDLAKHLGVGAERANIVGMKEDPDFKVYVDPLNPVVRTRFFRRKLVLGAQIKRSEPAEQYMDTHITLKQAMKELGRGRGAVGRLVRDGSLHPVRVSGGGKRGIYYLYSKEEISNIKKNDND